MTLAEVELFSKNECVVTAELRARDVGGYMRAKALIILNLYLCDVLLLFTAVEAE